MNELVLKAVEAVNNSEYAYSKFLSANDSGETGGHQSGILVSKLASKMMFSDQDMRDNHILKKEHKIRWQDYFVTNCTFTWYESKNELRLTGFGRGFEFRCPQYTGALFVFVKNFDDEYCGYVFNTDEDIQNFLDSFGLTPAQTNRLIELEEIRPVEPEKLLVTAYVQSLNVEFPMAKDMSSAARMIYSRAESNYKEAILNPDSALIQWTEQEYRIFKAIENERYGNKIAAGFKSVDDFVMMANHVLNRRKSRAGKSLEYHLAAIFDDNKIKYSAQAVTEGNKKPDFLFPSAEAYHDESFLIENLCMLAAKTTCKDRWRQILNEADRFKDENKYLCTMQQGISAAQMDEMQSEKVVLVVPKPFISAYPKEKRDRIWTISKFVNYIKEIEGLV